MYIILLCISLVYAASVCEGYKVLVVFPTPVKSHGILGNGVVRNLLNAGHEVTYVTPYPKMLKQHPLLNQIDVSSMCKLFPEEIFSVEKLMKREIEFENTSNLLDLFVEVQVTFLQNDNVIQLLSDPNKDFDVIILEWMYSEMMSGISTVFNCPFIWLNTMHPHWMVLKLIDELPNPAYFVSTTSQSSAPLSFLQRAEELLAIASGLSWQYFYISSIEKKEFERLLVPFIHKRNHKVPDFEELRYNASFILSNSHVSIGKSIRLPENYKNVGGYHIDEKVDPLPKDLKKLLDNAKSGLIYFSMGSNIKAKFIPAEIKANLFKMFGKLKQIVLWKFEEDLSNAPGNVYTVKWAPQHSILAHPNCILFISHGGLLSTTEAIHFGKPMIGIPLYGDQFGNVQRSVRGGYMKRVDMSYNLADDLEIAIKDILSNSSYSAKAKEVSSVYHDRPVSPGKELVHWIEHVIRTGGAPHLRSPALMVPWYQKWYLDLAFVIIGILSAALLIVKQSVSTYFKQKPKRKTH